MTPPRKPKKRPTVTDISAAAQVSVATVSRALNFPETVSEDTRNRVLAVANELGYVINPAAKALRMNKTQIVGAIIPTLDHAFYAKLVNSFQETLVPSGYAVFILSVGFDNSKIYEQARALVERGAQGLLVVGRIYDERLRNFISERRIATVTTYTYTDDADLPAVGFDNYAATRQMVDYLVGLGHRRLAMIAGPQAGNDRQQSRVKAFLDAHAALGFGDPWPVIERSYGDAVFNGAEAMRHIHTEFHDVTAVVCNSDTFAFGAIAECRRMGLRVPQDISIAGHDDQAIAGYIDPPLTTIAVPAKEMGVRSAEALVNALDRGREIRPVRLDANLIIRTSTAPPRG